MDKKKNEPVINDIVFGLILVAVCIFFCFQSIILSRPKGWLTAPGLFPLVIFSSLGVMGLFLLIGALKSRHVVLSKDNFNGFRLQPAALLKLFHNKTAILILIFLIYYNFLCRILPFELSTAIYLFVIFKLFWDRPIRTLLISTVIITTVFSLVFGHVLNVMLPGIAWRDILIFFSS